MSNHNPDQDEPFESFDEGFDEGLDGGFDGESSEDSWGSDEDDYVEGEGDADFEESADAQEPAEKKAKKKGGLFNIILIAAAVIVGGGFFVFQMATKPSAPVPMDTFATAEMAQAAPEAPAPAVPPPPPMTPSAPTLTEVEDQGVLGGSDVDILPAVASPVGQDVPQESPPEALQDSPAPVPQVSDEVAPIRLPSAQDVMLKATPATEETLAPSPAPASAQQEQGDVTALEETLKGVMTRLDQMEVTIQSLQNTAPATASALAAPDEATRDEINMLKSTVESLQKTVSDLKRENSKPVQVKSETRPPESRAAPESASDAVVPARPQILGPSDTDPAPVRGAEPAQTSVRWVLRGAQPGQAIVAREGQTDSQTIRPGDTLPGIGRITAIVYKDGRWVVEGTRGAITQ